MPDFLHNHSGFLDIIRIVAESRSILPALVEKDYWIMHSLYGLQKMELDFQLKGGTSLSKGYDIIDRFSEDIDIHITPPPGIDVKTSKNHNKPAHCKSRENFYNFLSKMIKIDGIPKVARDCAFDDEQFRSGGIRLQYDGKTEPMLDLKEGILLEVGFDDVAPNKPQLITSWVYDYAISKEVDILDNRALAVLCYEPGYTLVEKLQAISTKYRQQQEKGGFPINFIRHYYDVYCLLGVEEVQKFIGSSKYMSHKNKRFRSSDNLILAQNEAFLLSAPKIRNLYAREYEKTKSLYYNTPPSFDEILKRIALWLEKL